MDNGKFQVSVSSGNLVVSLKTLSGADPSCIDPVSIRIGDTIHSIVTALSVTRNAGTNWCDSASSMTAGRKLDFFVYIGYSAIDGIWIGFSRLPYAQCTDYFKPNGPSSGPLTNTTESFYCAMSNDANEADGDLCEQIGRFCAILSSIYQWSVPSFPGIYVVQEKILESRWIDFTPTVTSESGAITSYDFGGAGVCRYKIAGKQIYIQTYANISDKGSAGGYAYISLPHTCTIQTFGCGFDAPANACGLVTATNGNHLKIYLSNGSSPFINGAELSTFTTGVLETEEA